MYIFLQKYTQFLSTVMKLSVRNAEFFFFFFWILELLGESTTCTKFCNNREIIFVEVLLFLGNGKSSNALLTYIKQN